jgi:curved DNA-binding protein CbpA
MERIQDRHQENQALTHYDDLGLRATATDEEIREAYLNLVRLLHPDLQREPSLKRFAENQMKRVSRAYAVLSDLERRRRYDAELANGGPAEPEAPISVERSAGRSRARALITIGWLICAFAGTVGIGWYVSQQTSASSEPTQVNAATSAPVAGTRVAASPGSAAEPGAPAPADAGEKGTDLESVRSELAAARQERDRALDQTVRQAKELDFLTNSILAAPPRPLTVSSSFPGVWTLSPSKITPVSSAFTPEAVDLIMGEEQGKLQGRYRARYPNMGGPESPMVRFYFEGSARGDVANGVWTGGDGSRGEIQLKLTSDNTLQLVWSITDAGNANAPASGTVALVRKRQP